MKRNNIAKLVSALMMFAVPEKAWSAGDQVPSAEARSAETKGLAAARGQRFADAVRYFEQARNAAPYWAENLYYLGVAEEKLGHELRAAAWLNAYLALESKSPKAEKIREEVALLEQKAGENARKVISVMQEMAVQFPEGQLDREKANGVLFSDELALVGVWKVGEVPPDSSHAYELAERLITKGASKHYLARRFADFGRIDLAVKISGQDPDRFWSDLSDGRYVQYTVSNAIFLFFPQFRDNPDVCASYNRLVSHAAPAMAVAFVGDDYQRRVQNEELTPWGKARPPKDFVRELSESRPDPCNDEPQLYIYFNPCAAVDQWSKLSTNHLSDPLFIGDETALSPSAISARVPGDTIDKAGAVFNGVANSAAILLDGLTAVTTAERTLVVRADRQSSGKDVCQELPISSKKRGRYLKKP